MKRGTEPPSHYEEPRSPKRFVRVVFVLGRISLLGAVMYVYRYRGEAMGMVSGVVMRVGEKKVRSATPRRGRQARLGPPLVLRNQKLKFVRLDGPMNKLANRRIDMARPNVAGRYILPRKREKGIIINEYAAASRARATKLPMTGWKVQRAELRSKRLNDPSRIKTSYDTTPPPIPDQVVVPTPLAHGPPPRSTNRLKTEGLRAIIKEKRLSTNEVIDKHSEIISCLRYHKFQIFTRPRGPYNPNWVPKFYTAYGALVTQKKK
uniref:Uncharacterized protein n=1 Tax=Solanum tuberosum TaxID=4113 RepID=M1DEZ5_SOLTU